MRWLSVEDRYATQAGTHHEAGPWSASRIRPRRARGKGGSARQTHDDEPLHFAEENKNTGPDVLESISLRTVCENKKVIELNGLWLYLI